MERSIRSEKRGARSRSLSVGARVARLRETVTSGGEAACEAILGASRDRSPIVRAAAAELIGDGKWGAPSGALHGMLADSSDLVRGEAIEALGAIEERTGRHFEDLVSHLRDAKPMIRIAAIESLVRIQDLASIPQLEACLTDEAPLVRAYAAIALAELGCSACLAHISNAFSSEKDEAAAAGMLVAMFILGDDSGFATLLTLLASTRYRVRCFVANWLAGLTLNDGQLAATRAYIEEALRHPLGVADSSTMSRVLLELGAPTVSN